MKEQAYRIVVTIISFVLLFVTVQAQTATTCTFTFTGRDAGSNYVQLNRVVVTNHTSEWEETLVWPDTVLTLEKATDIEESVANGGFNLSQNNPNPFTGTTDVNLTVADAGAVTLEIADVNGRVVETWCTASLQFGTHQFRITLSAAGTYVMTARQNGKSSSIKMVNNGGGNGDGIEYMGIVETMCTSSLQTKSHTRGTVVRPFNFGDQMEYVGYATINGIEEESQHITQNQEASETFVLRFPSMQISAPTVVTAPVDDITANSATCGGEVVWNGGMPVTERGACWSTSRNPTVVDNHIAIGAGTGSFSGSVTGLLPNTTYYVRAYAINSVGTAYGSEVAFTTGCDSVVIVISGNTVIHYGESTTLTASGADSYRWNTDATTSFIRVSPSVTTTYVVTGSNQYGCSGTNRVTVTVNPVIPAVRTNRYATSGTDAVIHGTVMSDGGDTVIARGVCWNTVGSPTLEDNFTTDSSGMGAFTSSLTGLSIYTAYYVRTYATNRVGTAYGNQMSLYVAVLPSVVTADVADITAITASCGGEVTADGGDAVTARGVCWSTSPNPTVADRHTVDSSGTGGFSSGLTGLYAGTTYYVRAYATNREGTGYGNEVVFITDDGVPEGDAQPCPGRPSVTDIDGNVYNTVRIGNQCWMRENLRTTRYADSTEVPGGTTASFTLPQRIAPANDEANVSTFGYLYNWSAVMHGASSSSANPSGVRGVCPTGWHVPSDAEWTQLFSYVSSQTQSTYICEGNSSYISRALADTMCWESGSSCTPGSNPSMSNATGFSARPAGCYAPNDDFAINYYAYFWSATAVGSGWPDLAFYRSIMFQYPEPNRNKWGKNRCFSVRCILDGGFAPPVVITDSVSECTSATAVCSGNVISFEGSTVTARGVCWSTSPNPTTNDYYTTDTGGTGSFTSTLTLLIPNTTYYVRAYAIATGGMAYGNEVVFTTPADPFHDGEPCTGAATVTDRDSNVYNTVQIGYQCWMKENLRTTQFADGTPIAQGSEASAEEAYWFYPNSNPSNKTRFGLLYNWVALMHGADGSTANPSGVQGICPDGWHVPSDAEWTQLTSYVGSRGQYVCGHDSTYIAKALAASTWWSSINTNCAIGSLSGNSNATGFGAMSAGNQSYGYAEQGYYWSATSSSDEEAYYRYFNYASPTVQRYTNYKSYGYSVRCIRD